MPLTSVWPELLHLAGSTGQQLKTLVERFDLRLVAYTRGARGSILCAKDRRSDHPGLPGEVKDTVGADDSFTAAVTLGLLAGWDLDRINHLANEVATYVCSCAGATPPMSPQLRRHFQTNVETQHAGSNPAPRVQCGSE